MSRVRENLKRLAEGNLDVLFETDLLKFLPEAVRQLVKNERYRAVEMISQRLCEGLNAGGGESHRTVVDALNRCLSQLPEELRSSVLRKNRGSLGAWLQREEDVSPADEEDESIPLKDTKANASSEEELLDQYMRDGDKKAAVQLLYNMIVKHAEGKDFKKAEELRDRIFEVDPMALNEITKSAEIIEQGKAKAMDPIHRQVWAQLYESLTPEEANALFYAMKEASYNAGDSVFAQGGSNQNLYFIDHGNVQVTFSQGGREVSLRTLGPANFAGEEAFFSYTVNTTSVKALSALRLHYLNQADYLRLKENVPGLDSKIREYCLRLEGLPDLLKKKRLERRADKRITVSGHTLVQILNPSGESLGKAFKGGVINLSPNGLAVSLRISKDETARQLIGRPVNLQFLVRREASDRKFNVNGRVVGIRSHTFDDHSVHIRFDERIQESLEGIKSVDIS